MLLFPPMPALLAALDAFPREHRRCGDLDGDSDGEHVWLACSCGARDEHPLDRPDGRLPRTGRVARRSVIRPRGMSRLLVAAPSGSTETRFYCCLRRLQRASPIPAIVVPKRRSVAGSGTGSRLRSPVPPILPPNSKEEMTPARLIRTTSAHSRACVTARPLSGRRKLAFGWENPLCPNLVKRRTADDPTLALHPDRSGDAEVRYQCYPDTVDPRGPKGK
jgi:hypothetical protein